MGTLAIDYGLVRFGVAYSEGDIASGVGSFTVKTNEKKRKLMQKLITDYQPTTLVFGKSSGTIDTRVAAFITDLQSFYDGQIILIDETMTTRLAQESAIASNINRKKRQQNIDMYAAEIILQSYLDCQKAD